jgi:preprotein translocase subunit SecE
MKPAADKALIYTIAVIVCVVVIWTIVFAIPAALFGVGMM